MSDTQNTLPPPQGDEEAAQRYVSQLITLIDQDKIKVAHTDLKAFEPCSTQDHYRIDLDDYDIEVSHTIQPDNDKDFFIMLFNNIKKLDSPSVKKVILAYVYLTANQFHSLKEAAEVQIERIRKALEEKRFKAALEEIDVKLAQKSTTVPTSQEADAEVDDQSQEVKFEQTPKAPAPNFELPPQANL